MSQHDISAITVPVPTFTTSGLTAKVEGVRDALATKAAARDTRAADHLRSLIEILRSLGL